jgi:hypothetical protein
MKRPNKEDYRPENIYSSEDYVNWLESYSIDLEKYIDYITKQCN